MKLFNLFIAIILIICIGNTSCKSVYQNTMFNNVDSSFISRSINKLNDEYLIKNGDEISVKLYSRKGANIVEAIKTNITNVQDAGQMTSNSLFTVSNSGFLDLPIIGNLKVEGMTEAQLKSILEKKFSVDYIDPFVILKVENRRVFLFKGNTGAVVPINRTPTSIFEVIAKSGGLDRHLSTSNVLIIRGNLKSPTVYQVDLKTFKSIQNSETILQSNDIVYIPEKNRKLYYTMLDITPVVSVPLGILSTLMSSIVLIITLSK